MKNNALCLILVLVTFFAGAVDALANTRKGVRRCFVIIESASENMGGREQGRAEIRRIGKEAKDISALQNGLKALGEVRVVKLKTYSVVFVKIGHQDTKALDQVIHIDSFTGSPAGLLQRIATESGANWTHMRTFAFPILKDTPDSFTRITVTDFRGSIRQFLAETIPPSYGSLAFDVHCYPDGMIEVTQPGHLQLMEWQFRADPVIGALPKPVNLSPDEREHEVAAIGK